MYYSPQVLHKRTPIFKKIFLAEEKTRTSHNHIAMTSLLISVCILYIKYTYYILYIIIICYVQGATSLYTGLARNLIGIHVKSLSHGREVHQMQVALPLFGVGIICCRCLQNTCFFFQSFLLTGKLPNQRKKTRRHSLLIRFFKINREHT